MLFYIYLEFGYYFCNMIGIEVWWIILFCENNIKDIGDILYWILLVDDKCFMKNVFKGICGIINGVNFRLDEFFWCLLLLFFKGMF